MRQPCRAIRYHRRQRSGNSDHIVHPRPAIERKVAARRHGARRAFGNGAGQCRHVEIIGQQQPGKPDRAAHDIADHPRGQRRRRGVIPRGETDMRSHGDFCVGQRPERGQIGFERCDICGYRGQCLVAVGGRTAMPGHMFDHAGDPRARQTIQHRAAQGGNAHRLCTQRAIADHIIGTRLAHIEQRQAIDCDSGLRQVQPQRFCIRTRRLDRADWRQIIQSVEHALRRIWPPLRRLHPRHAAALLIDTDVRMIAAMNRAQIICQRAQLRPVGHIAAKQDIAGRIGLAEESALCGGQDGAGKAENCR